MIAKPTSPNPVEKNQRNQYPAYALKSDDGKNQKIHADKNRDLLKTKKNQFLHAYALPGDNGEKPELWPGCLPMSPLRSKKLFLKINESWCFELKLLRDLPYKLK